MLETYQRAMVDPELLNLTDELAVLQARFADVLKRTQAGEATRLWIEVRKAWQAFLQAKARGDVPGMNDQIDTVTRLVGRGAGEASAWQEAVDLADRIRKMSESEQKRRVAMQDMMNSTEGTTLALALLDAVRREVDDPAQLARISDHFVRITAGHDRDRTPALNGAD